MMAGAEFVRTRRTTVEQGKTVWGWTMAGWLVWEEGINPQPGTLCWGLDMLRSRRLDPFS